MAIADDVRRLADAAEKLLAETQRLRRDVLAFKGRIEPFDGETELALPKIPLRTRWKAVDAINVIDAARESIWNSERDLSAIRAKLDEIMANEARFDEIRPHIKR